MWVFFIYVIFHLCVPGISISDHDNNISILGVSDEVGETLLVAIRTAERSRIHPARVLDVDIHN